MPRAIAAEIERKLEIPDININFELDRPTLLAEIRSLLEVELEERGFDATRKVIAPTGVDEEPA